MLYVFHVDTGTMMTFDMSLALERCMLCAAAVFLLLGRTGQSSGREIDAAQAYNERNGTMNVTGPSLTSHPFSCMQPAFIDLLDVVTSKIKLAPISKLINVCVLKKYIEQACRIPPEKQVLLVSGGDHLDEESKVCSYSAGTDTNPIYLFSKSVIESLSPPCASIDYGSDFDFKKKLLDAQDLPASYDTVVQRAQLAQQLHEIAKEQTKICERLVHDQHLQQQGWAAVVANLEDLTVAFKQRSVLFETSFDDYLNEHDNYIKFLQYFNDDLEVLAKIPMMPTLIENELVVKPEGVEETKPEEGEPVATDTDTAKPVTLLEWISSTDSRSAMDQLFEHCNRGLEQFDEKIFKTLHGEIEYAIETSNKAHMKEVRGLGDRLFGLEQLMHEAKKYVREQADIAASFQQNQTRAGNLGDASILPDLCDSHRKQLVVMNSNHEHLCDIRRRCTKAKEELSINLYQRLRWVMYVENLMSDANHKLRSYYDNLKRLRQHLEVLQQIHLAPSTYLSAVAEVVRRRAFSQAFLLWASELACHLLTIHNEETTRRKEFQSSFEGHFLSSLFPGMDDLPPPFATQAPSVFDSSLPKISVDDLEALKEQLPDMTENLAVPDITAISNLFFVKSIVKTELDKVDERGVEEKLVEVVNEAGLASNSDQTLLKPAGSENCLVSGLAHLNLDKGCESETDTEEFEKVCQSPLEIQFDKELSSPRPGTQDVSTTTEVGVQSSIIPPKKPPRTFQKLTPTNSTNEYNLTLQPQRTLSISATSLTNNTESFCNVKNPSLESIDELSSLKNIESIKSSCQKLCDSCHKHNCWKIDICPKQSCCKFTSSFKHSDTCRKHIAGCYKHADSCQKQIDSCQSRIDNCCKHVVNSYKTTENTLCCHKHGFYKQSDNSCNCIDKHIDNCQTDSCFKNLENCQKPQNDSCYKSSDSSCKQSDSCHKHIDSCHTDSCHKFGDSCYNSHHRQMRSYSSSCHFPRSKSLSPQSPKGLLSPNSPVLQGYQPNNASNNDFVTDEFYIDESLPSSLSIENGETKGEYAKQLSTAHDVVALLQDDLQTSRTEHDKVKSMMEKLAMLSRQAIMELKKELFDLKSLYMSEKSTIETHYESLSSSWENLTLERDNKEREIIQRLSVDHALEIDNFKQIVKENGEEIKSLRDTNTHLENTITKINEENTQLKLELNEATEKCTQESNNFKTQLTELAATKDKTARELTDTLMRSHKAEMESIRTRFRLIKDMDRSPSDPSLEKIEKSDVNHEAMINQVKENCESEKQEALKVLLESETIKWEVRLADEIQSIKDKFEADKQMLIQDISRRVTEDKDKQIDVLREREANLNLECIKYKSTIQQLAECEYENRSCELIDKVEYLEREKCQLEVELSIERSKRLDDMVASVAVCEGNKVDAATSPVKQKEKLTRSQVSLVKSGRLNIESCSVGDAVLILWDSTHESYIILQEGAYLYFLHSHSLDTLGLKNSKMMYCTGEVVEKEYCHAKRQENRYKVPKGTKFYRIRVKPLSAPKDMSKSHLHHMTQSHCTTGAAAVPIEQSVTDSACHSLPSTPTKSQSVSETQETSNENR